MVMVREPQRWPHLDDWPGQADRLAYQCRCCGAQLPGFPTALCTECLNACRITSGYDVRCNVHGNVWQPTEVAR